MNLQEILFAGYKLCLALFGALSVLVVVLYILGAILERRARRKV